MIDPARGGGHILLPAALFLFLTVAGCSQGPAVVEISGTATRGGQPVADLVVTFHPDQGRPSWGFTDAQGRFTLHYDNQRDGAVVGRHRVYVNYQPRDTEVQLAITEGTFEYPPNILAIEEKYGNPETTPLSFDIQESREIELELD
jgi:hypothetical protein